MKRLLSLLTLTLAAPAHAAAALDFELPRLDGSAFVRLSDHAGQPLLLNFWRSDCPPCAHEMPLLSAQAARHPAVPFLGIAVEDRRAARRFVQRSAPAYPQLVAPSQPEVLLRRFGNTRSALPYTVVLDAAHRPCATREGEVDAAWIDAALSACAR